MTIILIPINVPGMYICLCNGHKERDIRRAAQAGARCVRTIYEQLGGPPRCGRCLPMAERLIGRLAATPQADAPGETITATHE